MRRLRKRFADELVVIGVHSPKFETERDFASLRAAVERHGIGHPIVHDPERRLWDAYAVRAWPTLVLIDPAGRVVAQQAGEIDADELAADLEVRIGRARSEGLLAAGPLFETELPGPRAGGMLRYPSKVVVAGPGRLFVADTAHHRVLELRVDPDRPRARLVRSFGRGEPGLVDGPAGTAAFHNPHGLALDGRRLLVADTDNHAVRVIDLESGRVETLAGTGRKAREPGRGGPDALRVPLRSPWALLPADGGTLLIAMAGSHQIWSLSPSGRLGVFAGTGSEALVDGPRLEAGFNQPSDLAWDIHQVLVADAEASAIRAISFEGEARVTTLVGRGLFDFGDQDGVGADVQLQHPTGLAAGEGRVYLADTYNHKVKTLNPMTAEVRTLVGTGEPGHEDGDFEAARLFEPEGLALGGGFLWVADTNNHALRRADLARRRLETVTIEGEAG